MSPVRRTLVAVALAAALGLVYGGWAKVLKPRREKAAEDAKLIFPGATADGLDEILLRKQGNPDVRALRAGGQWSLAAPIQAPADAQQIGALVGQLANAKRAEVVVDKGADLHEFGLDKPSGAVTFRPSSPGAKALALFFGSDNPTGRYAYGMVDGLPAVFLVDLSLKTSALKSAADLRDKAVWSFDAAGVQSVSMAGGSLRRDKGNWTVQSPAGVEPAKANGVGDWLGQVAALKADSVPSEEGRGAFGLGSGKALDLGLSNGSHLKLLLGARGRSKDGKKPSGIYVQVSGRKPVYLLPDSDLAVLEKKAVDLADRNGFLLGADAVQSFDISGAGATLKASQAGGSWAWISRTAAAGEPAFNFSAFVSKFAGTQLLKRLPLSAKPAKPARTVRFYDANGNLLETAELGAVRDGGQVAFSAGKHEVNLLANNLLEGLPGLAPSTGSGQAPSTGPRQVSPPKAAPPSPVAAH